jgi:integrase
MKLTKRTVDELGYQGENNAACYYWDEQLQGFGLRVYPTGRKSFVLAYRTNGRKRFLTLGNYGRLTPDEARRMAKIQAGGVEQGADPQADKERIAQAGTMAELCAAFMERHAKPKLKTWQGYQRQIDRHILPRWGNIKAQAITADDVAALHTAVGKHINPKTGQPTVYEANRLAALLSKLFNMGRKWGFLPAGAPNPAQGLDKFREQSRDRWVRPEELPRLAQAINEEANESARLAIWLFLLTGCRKSELLEAKWEDIDWGRAELRLADTKAGRVHYVPLTPPAIALLDQAPRREGNPYICPGKPPKPGEPEKHLVNISKPWNRVRKAAGVEDVRLHDLRRTVGSWLAQAGNSLHLVGKVLNHSNQSTTQIYARLGEDQARTALEQHAARLLGAAGLTEPGEVVPIRKQASQ